MSRRYGNPDIAEAGKATQFSKTNPPKNPGRKPSKLKKWIKENGVSKSDYISIFNNIIATRTIEELKELIEGDNKDKLPVIVALCISAIIHDMKTGSLSNANSILDRIIGKPAQKDVIEISAINSDTMALLKNVFSQADSDK